MDNAQTHNSRVIITILLAHKTLVFLAIYLSQFLLPLVFNTTNMMGNFNWGQSTVISFSTYFRTWDANIYLFLSELGYQTDHIANAMYPLWPYLIRTGAFFTGNSLVSALLLSNLLSFAGLYLLHKLVFDLYGGRIANYSILLLLAFPGAFYLNLAYAESLFLFLCVLTFFFLHKQQYLAAALVSFFIPLVKAVGLFILIPLALVIYDAYKNDRVPLHTLLLIALPLLGYASYFLVMYIAAGDALAGFKAQAYFIAKSSVWKLLDIVQFTQSFFNFGLDHTPFTSVFDRLWFVFVSIGLFLLYRINRTYFYFSLPLAIIPAIGTSFMSYTRYAAVIFPIFIACAHVLHTQKWQVFYWLIFAGFSLVQLIFLLRHVTYYWVA